MPIQTLIPAAPRCFVFADFEIVASYIFKLNERRRSLCVLCALCDFVVAKTVALMLNKWRTIFNHKRQ
jgi:hypothetical protein